MRTKRFTRHYWRLLTDKQKFYVSHALECDAFDRSLAQMYGIHSLDAVLWRVEEHFDTGHAEEIATVWNVDMPWKCKPARRGRSGRH